jgi:hypothetical protein
MALCVQVQEPACKQGVMPGTSAVQFELSKPALSTMLDGLSKIRDQLSSISG